MAKRAFGELESQILLILKDGTRKTVKDVHQELGGKDNYNTVMTVMSRLAQKKILSREKIGLQYAYWIIKDANKTPIFDKLKHKFLGIPATELINHLIESEELTDEELFAMEKLLQKKREAKKS